MARYHQDGSRRPTDLFEAAAWHYGVIATCMGCGRETVFDPHALWWLFESRGWDNTLWSAGERFRCEGCKGRPRLSVDRSRQATVLLPLPDERDWKRAVDRFRA